LPRFRASENRGQTPGGIPNNPEDKMENQRAATARSPNKLLNWHFVPAKLGIQHFLQRAAVL
jgi:hypothetical protein